MATKAAAREAEGFFDTEPFWVIWQASIPVSGVNRIRRISQNYHSAERAEISPRCGSFRTIRER